MPTLTVNPDTGNPGAVSVDGSLEVDVSGYANAHDAANANTVYNVGIFVGQGRDGANFVIRRGIGHFDTSSLGSTATITAATTSLYLTAITNDDNNDSISIVLSGIASNTTIAAADYSGLGTVKQATDISLANLTNNAYNEWTLNSTGQGNISLTGVTKFGWRSALDISNTANTNNNTITGQSAEEANKPKLVVTYTKPVAGGNLLLMGVG